MPILTHDCPRCPTTSAAFTSRGGYVPLTSHLPHTAWLLFACPKCSGPLLVLVQNPQRFDLTAGESDLRDVPQLRILRVEPEPKIHAAPSETPAAAADAYIEALDSLHRGKWTSAASMLRRTLEIALRQFSPEIEAWKLEKRIDKLADAHKITPALQQWAHELRLDGNEALHGTAAATEELATRMERLTFFLLTYLFTLPAEVEDAKVKRDQATD